MTTTHDGHSQTSTKQACFLCSLDPKGECAETQLEGRIIAAQERVLDGEKTPIVLLDTGTARIELLLDDQYYRNFVKDLKAKSDALGSYHLTLRVYHLPTASVFVEHNGRTRQRYKANSYTMAVLEPDTLLNITDLNQAEYCSRQYLLKRLASSPVSAATIRGNLVHHCFKELLKEHDRGKFHISHIDEVQETPLATLHRHLEQALHLNAIDLALANVSPEGMRADVAPHLESLAHWYERERDTLWDMPAAHADNQEDGQEPSSGNQVRAETFLLAPEIGLRGRLDLFWQQSGRQRLLELKTGGATGELPKREHRWQVNGYHALLTVRRDSKMKKALATLLYSGTPGSAQAHGIPATIRDIQRVNQTRNTLVLSHITGIPPAPPGPSRCTKCAMLVQCQKVSSLLSWQPPEPDNRMQQQIEIDTSEDREFFAKYYQLLQLEGRAGEQQQALLWKMPVAERLERGTAISGLELQGTPTIDRDGWEQTYHCVNTSELREGDEVLLSDGNPITGEVVTGTILSVSSTQVTVWTRELIARPTLIDRYDNDLVHVRTLQNLLRWLQATPHIRDLVAGKIRPRFIGIAVPPRPDFNREQNLAVERALQMQDYLLIHGPPGTGKTSVIAEIVKRLTQQGQRVLLSAFTNQAVDNMLKRLDQEGFHEYLRLGHERSVNDTVKQHLLKELVETQPDVSSHAGDLVRNIITTMPVVATTTATWSSDKYIPQTAQHEEGLASENTSLSFDVAIIDEAGQLTVPAILGALRFVRRFILVGDEKQLPPLVLSKEAAINGLSDSLFSFLKRLDDDYRKNHPETISASVPLRTQYRMNKWISNFSSTVFYDKELMAHESVANRKLEFVPVQWRGTSTTVNRASFVHRASDSNLPLVFVDVRDPSANAESKISNAEAQTVREVIANLLVRGIEQKDIGIIAPYRAQVANIRRHLFSDDVASKWQALPATSPMSVDTVDRFQGGERMVIIMSFATTSEPQGERREFLTNPNRLNVALTRAQRKLILVGCVPALENLPIFSRLITYCRSMKTIIATSLQ
ncbi:MAG TPA: AAA domain-containing protein [Ktedonobacteraceae bacterium]|nr:AAA domain-containing protein [Ktedonobacteraceae bacterium]